MTIETKIILTGIETPLKHTYMVTEHSNVIEGSRLVFDKRQFFFALDDELGFNKNMVVSHEWNIDKRKLYYHIICCGHANNIVAKANRNYSISAGHINRTLMLSKQDTTELVNRDIGSYVFKTDKFTYREIDRSGERRTKGVYIGFRICLDPVISILGLNRKMIIKRLSLLSTPLYKTHDLHIKNRISSYEQQIFKLQQIVTGLENKLDNTHIPKLQKPTCVYNVNLNDSRKAK